MASTQKNTDSYTRLSDDLKRGKAEKAYVFYGEEQYLIEHSLKALRAVTVGEGFGAFNHTVFRNSAIDLDELRYAVDTAPMMSGRTLIEIWDSPFFMRAARRNKTEPQSENSGDTQSETENSESESDAFDTDSEALAKLAQILSDLPEWACVVFLYDAAEYSPDLRVKSVKECLKYICEVEFTKQEPSRVSDWILRRVRAAGMQISRENAAYLAERSGGLMNPLIREIDILCASGAVNTNTISREDIDTFVEPPVEAAAWDLTDAITERSARKAFRALYKLIETKAVLQITMSTVTNAMRNLYAARVFINENRSSEDFGATVFSEKMKWKGRSVMQAARRVTTEEARTALQRCSECALKINSGGGSDALTDLVSALLI